MIQLPDIRQPDGTFRKEFPPLDQPIRLRPLPAERERELRMSRELVTCNTLSTIALADENREITREFIQAMQAHPSVRIDAAQMLPVRCSPTGAEPATHVYCDAEITDEFYWSVVRFRDSRTTEERLIVAAGDSAEFLQQHGLQRIVRVEGE